MSHSPAKRSESTGFHAFLVASGIFLSRIAGLIRERAFAHYFGNSEAAGAFRAALRIPNFLQNLFGEGVLSASFIPVYSRLLAEGRDELAGKVASTILSFLIALTTSLTIVGVVFASYFIDLIAPGFHGELRELTIHLVQIIFPGIGLLVISAWCLAILNSHRKFFVSYVAPVFWNFALITTLIIFGSRQNTNQLSLTLAWGSVVGSFIQLAFQIPFVFRYRSVLKLQFETKLEEVQIVLKNFVPVLISRGVVQLSAYVDGIIASYLGARAVAGLGYAQTIYLLPIGLFGMSIAAAELPRMSSFVGEVTEITNQLRTRLLSSQRKIAFLVIPSLIAFLFLGQNLVVILYQSGKFDKSDTFYVWAILMGSSVGLLAATWARLYSSAFYALRNTKTPLVFAVIRLIITAALGIIFAFPLRPQFLQLFHLIPGFDFMGSQGQAVDIGAAGLTLSAGLAAWVEYRLLKRSIEKRLGSVSIGLSFVSRIWAAAIISGLVALLSYHLLSSFFRIHPFTHSTVILCIYGFLYLALTKVFGVQGMDYLSRLLGSRSKK